MSHPLGNFSKNSIKQIGPAEALSLLVGANHASWRQYPAYARVAAKRAGAEQNYWTLSSGGEIIALANVRTKRLPIVGWGIAMIAQGPVILAHCDSVQDISVVYEIFARKLSQQLGASVRINSPVTLAHEMLQKNVALSSPQLQPVSGTSYQTFLLDLAADLETLHSNLNGKWRTDLRRGQRGSVNIMRSTKAEDFRRLQALLSELSSHKGFSAPQDADFFAEVAAHCSGNEQLTVHLAWHEDRLVGGHIGAFSGDMAVYLLGATNEEGRDVRASFLLQWAVIEYAKSLGLRYYDLGGVNQADNPSVYRFKKRMGGDYYSGPPTLEYRAAWPKGQIVQMAEQFYRKVRG